MLWKVFNIHLSQNIHHMVQSNILTKGVGIKAGNQKEINFSLQNRIILISYIFAICSCNPLIRQRVTNFTEFVA